MLLQVAMQKECCMTATRALRSFLCGLGGGTDLMRRFEPNRVGTEIEGHLLMLGHFSGAHHAPGIDKRDERRRRRAAPMREGVSFHRRGPAFPDEGRDEGCNRLLQPWFVAVHHSIPIGLV